MIERAVFCVGVAALAFLAGIYVGWNKLPPATMFNAGKDAAVDLWENWESYASVSPVKFLNPSRYPGTGVVVNEERAVQPGVTMMTGLWDAEAGITLRTLDGRELHRWYAPFTTIWPDTPHLATENTPFNDWDTRIHGALLYRNGDVVFNFDEFGLVRLDRCSRIVWRLAKQTHHSITAADDGHLWIPNIKQVHDVSDERFPGMTPPFREDSILEVSPDDGRVLREISLLESFYASTYEGALLAGGAPGLARSIDPDPLHTNNVETLPAAMAGAFPLFQAGDILVSMRNLNMLAVLDKTTGLIKWSKTGPWVRQHAGHFLPNGQIALLDNRLAKNVPPWAPNKPAAASRIVTVDPLTGHLSVLFEGSEDQPFFTYRMGKLQVLPNGNILVTEPEPGRAFEITPDRKVVWSFINRFDEARVAGIEQAIRYPAEYAAFAAEPCPADTVVGAPAPNR
ncbi:MAG: arylsulfotransferase family protein [Geminicoccaceae bacterium]